MYKYTLKFFLGKVNKINQVLLPRQIVPWNHPLIPVELATCMSQLCLYKWCNRLISRFLARSFFSPECSYAGRLGSVYDSLSSSESYLMPLLARFLFDKPTLLSITFIILSARYFRLSQAYIGVRGETYHHLHNHHHHHYHEG